MKATHKKDTLEPTNGGLKDDFPSQLGDFWVPAVHFPGCKVQEGQRWTIMTTPRLCLLCASLGWRRHRQQVGWVDGGGGPGLLGIPCIPGIFVWGRGASVFHFYLQRWFVVQLGNLIWHIMTYLFLKQSYTQIFQFPIYWEPSSQLPNYQVTETIDPWFQDF